MSMKMLRESWSRIISTRFTNRRNP